MRRSYEADEAATFDRLAEEIPAASLQIPAHTFVRYAAALGGHPLFDTYPDLAFVALGRHCRGSLQGLSVLDLGAGTGEWSAVLAHLGATVTALELSPKSVALADQRRQMHGFHRHGEWIQDVGSAYNLISLYGPRTFDVVFGQAILHHLTHDLPTVYRGVRTVLKPGGLCLFTEPYNGSQPLRWLRERLAFAIPIDRETPDERPITPEEVAQFYQAFALQSSAVYFDAFEKIGRRVGLPQAKTLDDRLPRPVLRRLASMVFLTGVKTQGALD